MQFVLYMLRCQGKNNIQSAGRLRSG